MRQTPKTLCEETGLRSLQIFSSGDQGVLVFLLVAVPGGLAMVRALACSFCFLHLVSSKMPFFVALTDRQTTRQEREGNAKYQGGLSTRIGGRVLAACPFFLSSSLFFLLSHGRLASQGTGRDDGRAPQQDVCRLRGAGPAVGVDQFGLFHLHPLLGHPPQHGHAH